MGKFSDPNYKLLKDYFDILVAVRNGTQKSFLIGPNKTVVSEGGLYTILYEDNPDRGEEIPDKYKELVTQSAEECPGGAISIEGD